MPPKETYSEAEPYRPSLLSKKYLQFCSIEDHWKSTEMLLNPKICRMEQGEEIYDFWVKG